MLLGWLLKPAAPMLASRPSVGQKRRPAPGASEDSGAGADDSNGGAPPPQRNSARASAASVSAAGDCTPAGKTPLGCALETHMQRPSWPLAAPESCKAFDRSLRTAARSSGARSHVTLTLASSSQQAPAKQSAWPHSELCPQASLRVHIGAMDGMQALPRGGSRSSDWRRRGGRFRPPSSGAPSTLGAPCCPGPAARTGRLPLPTAAPRRTAPPAADRARMAQRRSRCSCGGAARQTSRCCRALPRARRIGYHSRRHITSLPSFLPRGKGATACRATVR